MILNRSCALNTHYRVLPTSSDDPDLSAACHYRHSPVGVQIGGNARVYNPGA